MKTTRTRLSILAMSLFLILSAFAILPENVLGDTEYLDPDGDSTPLDWTPTGCSTHADCVDDAIRQPGTGVDSNYISTTENADFDVHTYENPVASGTVSDVEVWVYGRAGDSDDAFYIDVLGVTGWSPAAVETAAPGTSNSWVSASWTGLSIDMGDFNGMQVSIEAEQNKGGGGSWVAEAIYAELTYSAAAPASLTVTLRKSDNTQERIDVGYWGNNTTTPGQSNSNSTNFVRAQCDDCDGTDDAFWVNWSGTTWSSSKTGDTITIDNNFRFYYYETTSGTACPDDGGWTWSDSGVDADGDYQITFSNSGTTYVWVRFRIESVPSPLSGSDDYLQDYTVQLDR